LRDARRDRRRRGKNKDSTCEQEKGDGFSSAVSPKTYSNWSYYGGGSEGRRHSAIKGTKRLVVQAWKGDAGTLRRRGIHIRTYRRQNDRKKRWGGIKARAAVPVQEESQGKIAGNGPI